MRKFFIALLWILYFQAGMATLVYHVDWQCNSKAEPYQCAAEGFLVGSAWPGYWSAQFWRAHLNENMGRLLPRSEIFSGPGYNRNNER